MENPFANPLYLPLSQGGLTVDHENPLVKEPALSERMVDASRMGGNDRAQLDEGGFETRRSELKPEVRKYADKMHARLLDIYKKYGATDAEGMQTNVLRKNGPKIQKADIEEIAKLLNSLDNALTHDEIPERRELPPLQAFERMVEEVTGQLPHHKILGLDDWDHYQYRDGKISGRVKITDLWADVGLDYYWIPVISNKPIMTIKDENSRDLPITACSDIHETNNELNGAVSIGDKTLPVINGAVIRTMTNKDGQDLAIYDFSCVRNVHGELNGACLLENGRWLPIINGELIEELMDESGNRLPIYSVQDVYNSQGKLNCSALLTDSRTVMVVDGIAMYGITDPCGRKRALKSSNVIRDADGKLNGIVGYLDQTNLLVTRPIIDGVVQDQVMDRDGVARKFISSQGFIKDGQLNGSVLLFDKKELPVVDGVIIETIEDKTGASHAIHETFEIKIVGGKITGKIRLMNGKWLPAVDGKLIDEIEGRKIIFSKNFSLSGAGGVFSGYVNTESPNWGVGSHEVLLGKFLD